MELMKAKFSRKKSVKSIIKKTGALLLALSLMASAFPLKSVAAEVPAQFPTIANGDTINIGIASDVHLSETNDCSTLLRNCLEGFKSATSNNLDAVAFAGDLTDDGYVDELQEFRSIVDEELDPTTLFTACMGNHEFYKYGWGVSVDANPGMKEEMQSDFEKYIGASAESDVSVKGVHILSVSPDNELDSYTARESFLREKIQAAAAENPTNPIIIIAHKPVKYTVMSSGTPPDGSTATLAADWSDSFLEFLKQYPQIIYVSAHAHDDLSDPNMIYQEDYTSIQDGVVCVDSESTGILLSIDSNKVVTIHRMDFTTNSCFEPSWTIDIPKVIESKSNFQYRVVNTPKDINLTVGANASEMYVNWFNQCYQTGKVQYSKSSNLVDGSLSTYDEVAASSSGEAVDSTNYYNHALLKNLEPNTEYTYRVGNENGWSDYYTFKTPASSSNLNFLFAADAQIGSDGATDGGTSGWQNTIAHAVTAFPDAQFLLSAGDQVELAGNSTQYDEFFSPTQLTSLPLATVVGNHDVNSKSYSQHFAYSNVSDSTTMNSTGEYSGDYWFVRNSTLFMMLNTNLQDTQAHVNFMQQAILDAGSSIKWKVVAFHQSIFSTSNSTTYSDTIQRRNELAPAFSNLQIDLVLMGHDHSYTRTYMMDGTTPITADGVQSSVTNPAAGEVLYVTGNSSSGSKYYDILDGDFPYAAVTLQNYVPSITNVQISDTALTVKAYNSTDMSLMDSFTINKTQTTEQDTVKPYLFVPTDNKVFLNHDFDKLSGVSATDNVDGNITDKIVVTGEVNTAVQGTYTLTYQVTDQAGNTATVTRNVVVTKETAGSDGLYFGIDIKSGELKNEDNSTISYSSYTQSGSGQYVFEKDSELNQEVLCGPESGNLEISGLNLSPLNNQFTIEAYIKIPSSIVSYDVFQFDGQNVNVVGTTDGTYFGSGRSSVSGDADVFVGKKLPTDQWIHIVCTAKEGEQVLYVNGQEFSRDCYTGLNIASTNDENLILGGTCFGRSGLIKFAYFRIYSSFSTAEMASNMYTDMLNNFSADYTAVDNAIAAIPSDLTVYTDESVQALNDAVNAVVRDKNYTEQTTVDGYAAAINNAVSALVYKNADYTAVDAAIAKIPSDLTVYTDESVQALNDAVNAVVRSKNITEQATVDGYAAAINSAVSALVYKDADYTAVDAAIAKIPSNLTVYTNESVQALNDAVNAVVRSKNITEQATVDGYAAAINDAVNALVYKSGEGANYKAVDQAIAKIPADLTLYTDKSVQVLNDAVNAVVRGKGKDEQATVDGYAAAIKAAVKALVYKDADYTAVDAAIAKIPADLSVYTDKTVKKLNKAVSAVVRGKNITKQKIVDKYAADINNALKALVYKKAA